MGRLESEGESANSGLNDLTLERARQPEKAANFYAQLLKICEDADSDRPELGLARSLNAQQ